MSTPPTSTYLKDPSRNRQGIFWSGLLAVTLGTLLHLPMYFTAAVATALFGIETCKRRLEDITADELGQHIADSAGRT